MKLLNAKQESKLNMYQVVEVRCDDNSTIINANTAFKNAFAEFKTKIADIAAEAQKAGAVLTGIAADKTVSKKDLSRTAATIAGQIYAYAAKSGNNTLKQSVNFSVSDLQRLKDAELAPACQAIHDAGAANLAALADYGVTTAKLANLQTAIDNYTAAVPKPRAAVADRKVTKANIKELFKQADAILKEQMDRLIEDFSADNPDFVAQYKTARTIIDPQTGKKQTDDKPANPPA